MQTLHGSTIIVKVPELVFSLKYQQVFSGQGKFQQCIAIHGFVSDENIKHFFCRYMSISLAFALIINLFIIDFH